MLLELNMSNDMHGLVAQQLYIDAFKGGWCLTVPHNAQQSSDPITNITQANALQTQTHVCKLMSFKSRVHQQHYLFMHGAIHEAICQLGTYSQTDRDLFFQLTEAEQLYHLMPITWS